MSPEHYLAPESLAPAAYRLPEELPAVYWLQHWRALRANWKMLVLAAGIGAAAGLLIAAAQTRVYHAQASIEIQGIADALLKSPEGNPDTSSEISDMQTQIRIMQSESLIERVRARLAGSPGAAPRALKVAVKSLTVRAAGPTRIIEIGADSTDPRVAAAFVNSLAAEFIDQHIDARWQGTQRASDKLKGAIEEMRIRLEQSETTLQRYARRSGLLIAADRNNVSDDKLRQLQEELSHAQADRVSKQARFDAIRSVDAADLPSILNDLSITGTQEKLTDLRRQIADLQVTYAPGYPKLKRLEAQAAPLEAAIRKEASSAADRIRAEYAEAKGRETLLIVAYQAQAAVVSADAEKTVHYDILKREVDSTRTLYDTMLGRVKEAAIASTMRLSNVRVLDSAQPSWETYRPRLAQYLLLGTIVGLFLGMAYAATRDQAHQTMRAPGDISVLLSLPELGAVPVRARADAFRGIAASVIFAAESQHSRVFVVTSASPGEGKTRVCAHLAAGFAAAGKRVLLIDGDLRRPRLHEMLQMPAAPGFSELLAAPRPPDLNEMHSAARATPQPQLYFLASGSPSEGSSNLLYSARLRDILTYARKNFDLVLIDSPPLLQIPDARVIGRAADSVLLVVRAGHTSRDTALAARQRLFEDGTPVIGVVMTDWNPKRSPGYYGAYAGAALPTIRARSAGTA
jgi:capsular exopolysaccharide synthesis family protein